MPNLIAWADKKTIVNALGEGQRCPCHPGPQEARHACLIDVQETWGQSGQVWCLLQWVGCAEDSVAAQLERLHGLRVSRIEDWWGELEGAAHFQQEEAEDPGQLRQLPMNAELSRRFLDHWTGGRLVFWTGDFYEWDCGRYVLIPPQDFKAQVLGWMKHNMPPKTPTKANPDPGPQDITPSRVSGVLDMLRADTHIASVMPPFHIGTGGPAQVAILHNGTIDVEALSREEPVVLRPHSSDMFSLYRLPFDYQREAECPRWLSFLDRNLAGDQAKIRALQEWFGYNLLPWMQLQAFFLMVGDGANGKSVAMDVLRALVGRENCSSQSLDQFKERFGLWPMIGKLANISSEIGDADATSEGVLKAISCGEPRTIDRKNREPIEAEITARLTFSTNEPPRFRDKSGAIYRRLVMLMWDIQISESDQDPDLSRRIVRNELPGVFLWSVAGLERLRRQGKFTLQGMSSPAVHRLRMENDSAMIFLTDVFEPRWGASQPKNAIYILYRDWTKDAGYKTQAIGTFFKAFHKFWEIREIEVGEIRSSIPANGMCNLDVRPAEGSMSTLCPSEKLDPGHTNLTQPKRQRYIVWPSESTVNEG